MWNISFPNYTNILIKNNEEICWENQNRVEQDQIDKDGSLSLTTRHQTWTCVTVLIDPSNKIDKKKTKKKASSRCRNLIKFN